MNNNDEMLFVVLAVNNGTQPKLLFLLNAARSSCRS